MTSLSLQKNCPPNIKQDTSAYTKIYQTPKNKLNFIVHIYITQYVKCFEFKSI